MFIDRCFPIEKMDFMGGDMERLFSEFFPFQTNHKPKPKSSEERSAHLILDMVDKGSSIVVTVDVPGINKDDITITVEKNVLKLIVKQSAKDEFKDEEFYHMERNRLNRKRSVELPVKIDPDNIKASLKNGVLEITLSKAKDLQPQKIKVEAS